MSGNVSSSDGVSRRRVLGASGVALMALTASGNSARARESATPTAEDAFDPATVDKLDSILDTRVANGTAVGAMAGVWIPGRGTWVRASGIGDIGTSTPLNLDDHYRIASITKTFIATVVLQLVDAGELALDDKLESFIPGLPNGDIITIQHLLSMTSGLFDFVNDEQKSAAYNANPLIDFSPEEAVEMIRAHEPLFAPGDQVNYSNSNYVLLGLILEQVTGRSAASVLEEMVLTPLKLNETTVPSTPDLPEPYSHGYTLDAKTGDFRDVSRSNPAVPFTSGDMISTLGDLKIWAEVLATGTLLKPDTQAARLKTRPVLARSSFAYGMGILEAFGFVGHNGGIPGYSSFMAHRPDDGATFVAMENVSGSSDGGADTIFSSLLLLLYPRLLLG